MAHYIWKIPETSYNESDGFIFKCTYYVEAWENSDRSGASATRFGDITFTKPLSGFVEYKDITEEMMIQWVKNAIGLMEVKQLESDLSLEIDKFNYTVNNVSTTKTGVPWGDLPT